MAPELLSEGKLSTASDVYAFGMLIHEVCRCENSCAYCRNVRLSGLWMRPCEKLIVLLASSFLPFSSPSLFWQPEGPIWGRGSRQGVFRPKASRPTASSLFMLEVVHGTELMVCVLVWLNPARPGDLQVLSEVLSNGRRPVLDPSWPKVSLRLCRRCSYIGFRRYSRFTSW